MGYDQAYKLFMECGNITIENIQAIDFAGFIIKNNPSANLQILVNNEVGKTKIVFIND